MAGCFLEKCLFLPIAPGCAGTPGKLVRLIISEPGQMSRRRAARRVFRDRHIPPPERICLTNHFLPHRRERMMSHAYTQPHSVVPPFPALRRLLSGYPGGMGPPGRDQLGTCRRKSGRPQRQPALCLRRPPGRTGERGDRNGDGRAGLLAAPGGGSVGAAAPGRGDGRHGPPGRPAKSLRPARAIRHSPGGGGRASRGHRRARRYRGAHPGPHHNRRIRLRRRPVSL